MSVRPLDELAPSARIPTATYRLQFNRGFTLAQALETVEYLRALGITDIYASPLFQAGPESTHGYDVCSFEQINPALGGASQFRTLSTRLHELGMGLLLDMVPNHMGSDLSNPWWRDVLAQGVESPYAKFFDIDWRPARTDLVDKVLLPILGDTYGTVLEKGELQLQIENDRFGIGYYDRFLPINRTACADLLEQALSIAHTEGPYGNIEDKVRSFAAELRVSPARLADFSRQVRQWRELSPGFAKALESVCAATNGQTGLPRTFDRLHALLQAQHYRLAYWRVGPEEINYRRFFDVTQLVSLRIEEPEVFQATHAQLFDWLRAGPVTGLRIDHPDGLRDPKEYFERLQAAYMMGHLEEQNTTTSDPDSISHWVVHRLAPLEREVMHDQVEHGRGHNLDAPRSDPQARKAARPTWPLYVVAEKILSGDEPLRPDWPVHGTTGYDFLNKLNGLFVDPRHEKAFDQLYRDFSGHDQTAADAIYRGKKQMLETSLVSELNALTWRLKQVSTLTRYGQDYTFRQLAGALTEIIAAFPVYRTYATRTSRELAPMERAYVEKAVGMAKARNPAVEPRLLDYIQDLLLLRVPGDLGPAGRELHQEFLLRFQQLSGPATAKGVEDTAFYNYNRLLSLNEVGGEPDRFGVSVDEFHVYNLHKAEQWPHALLATATHDTKRGEDVRARLNVLSEMPGEWREAIQRWRQLNADQTTRVRGQVAPHPNDEYLLYQTLVGIWPPCNSELDHFIPRPPERHLPADQAEVEALPERVRAYMIKAMREGKARTTWTDPDTDYEDAVQEFVTRILDRSRSQTFLDDFEAFQSLVSYFAGFNSLTQVLLKTTCPGVPDFYQGTDLWDLTLVDPDNRRPVDYQARTRLLDEIRAGGHEVLPKLASATHTGAIKLYVLYHCLQARVQNQALFRDGSYVPLQATGAARQHVCGFARVFQNQAAVTIAPRLIVGLLAGEARAPVGEQVWKDTAARLPGSQFAGPYRNVLTGDVVSFSEDTVAVSDALGKFPLALLVRA